MKRQHPYSPRCNCTRCKAVRKLLTPQTKLQRMMRGITIMLSVQREPLFK